MYRDTIATMEAMKNIIVLGAGYGGITAALRLARLFRGHPQYRILLIDKNPYHTLKTQLHEAAIRKTEVSIPISRLVRGLDIEFHQTEAISIEPAEGRINTKEGPVSFEYLLISLGSQANFYGIPGLERYSFPLQSLDDAKAIQAHISMLCEQAGAEPDPERRKGMLRFVIGGGGLSGVEFAAELIEHIDRCLGHDSGLLALAEVFIIEGMEHIVPHLKESLSGRIHERLVKKGIRILTGTRIVSLTGNAVELSSGLTLPTRTLVWTGGIRIAGIVRESGLKTGAMGRIIVDSFLMAEGARQVYAIGDSALAINPNTGTPLPAAAQFALQQGRLAADNIYASAMGGRKKPYRPRVLGEVISLGRHLAVGWLALPLSRKLTFLGFIGSLIKSAIREKHIILLRAEARKWTVY